VENIDLVPVNKLVPATSLLGAVEISSLGFTTLQETFQTVSELANINRCQTSQL